MNGSDMVCNAGNNTKVMVASDSTNWLHIVYWTGNQINLTSVASDGTITQTNGTSNVDYRFQWDGSQVVGQRFTNQQWTSLPRKADQQIWYNNEYFSYDWYYMLGQNIQTNNEGINLDGWQNLDNNRLFYQFRGSRLWNINNIELKLYYLNNNVKYYIEDLHYDIYQTQIDIENNEPGYIVYYPYSENIPFETPIYQEMYYKNKYISTSNGVKWLPQASGGITIPPINQNIGQITNTSGDVTGNVNMDGLQEYLVLIVQTIKSGDDKIVATLESGEKANQERFEYWQREWWHFNSDSGEQINNIVSGEIFQSR